MTLGLDVVEGTSETSAGKAAIPSQYGEARGGLVKASAGLDKAIIRRYLRRYLRQFQYCYESQLRTKPSLAGTLALAFSIQPDGVVTRTKTSGLGNKVVEDCVARRINRIRFPRPANEKTVRVSYPIAFAQAPPGTRRGSPRFPPGWVLTRLHARYDRTSLGEDLIFKEAGPIAGGQGGASDTLKKTAQESRSNSFQGRYIIRHEWDGLVECENPQRGIWGGPPSDTHASSTIAATDLAFATRGTLSLASVLREPIPAIDLAADASVATAKAEPQNSPEGAPEVTPEVLAPEAENEPGRDESKSKGCSVVGGSGPANSLFFAIAVLLFWRRRGRS